MLKELRETTSDLWNYYKPPATSDPLEHRWRMRIATGMIGLLLAVVGTIFVHDLWPWSAKLARASETAEVKEQLAQILEQSHGTYKIALGQEICRLFLARQDATGRVHELLDRNFEEKQSEYAKLNDDRRYNIAECSKPKEPDTGDG